MQAKHINIILTFIKKQTVLVVAWILALISAFFVTPNKEYFSYIDWRSLGILWSLMVIMLGFQINGIFQIIGNWLLSKVHKLWQLILILVLLCFFLSMFITNDVALITFVPFAILILNSLPNKCKNDKLLIFVIVLQTIAANLGSMLTPIGNPQNLYLFGLGGFSLASFIKLMLPYSALSLFLLVICVAVLGRKFSFGSESFSQSFGDNGILTTQNENFSQNKNIFALKLCIFCALFVISILTVLHIISFYVLVPIVLIFMLIFERKSVLKADYFLLLTFIGFFIFTGNIAKIDFINEKLQNFVGGREILFGITSSQVISNVPAALLLSSFATNLSDLVIGVNLGGLGTLIASMASLISYKFYAETKDSKSGKYMFVFSAMNVLFLMILIILNFLLSSST